MIVGVAAATLTYVLTAEPDAPGPTVTPDDSSPEPTAVPAPVEPSPVN
jgi:hypothetical protein